MGNRVFCAVGECIVASVCWSGACQEKSVLLKVSQPFVCVRYSSIKVHTWLPSFDQECLCVLP